MKLRILSGAQTGVDMGAALEALACGLPLGGFMPADACNEDGPIPEHVALHLRRHDRTNPAARTRANVATADAALVIVQDRRRAGETRGTALTIRLCEARIRRGLAPGRRTLELLVVDPQYSPDAVAGWVATWPLSLLARRRKAGLTAPLDLLVAGPRASLWSEGEETARRIVHVIAEACRG